ncbi:hypothetical protein EDD16DRAFT_1729769 [Pisolithus croceorrhizus]|nr:hypothetical protein EDD16DRAFT_1729769 [Pisolithus croceorrhizus]KAI6110650.1 hypothetical protein EV401DRAFT_1891093 [Pisolithus croceorrhizus]KAI6152932.1 hypothetical protein EDD17DRAFT_1900093 [Pisolithus thermaeus]
MAIHLNPRVVPNVRFPADETSGVACIHGMILSLDEALGWLAELANVLMDHYKAAESSQKGGLSKQSLDKETQNEYPDPALLNGHTYIIFRPVRRRLSLRWSSLDNSFLNTRTKVLPPAQPPPVGADAMNPESQEEYKKLYLELDNAGPLAALGEEWSLIISKQKKMLCVSLLRLNPAVYPDDFVGVLLISSISFVLSIEHEYALVMFTLDSLQYPLFRGAPFQPVGHGKRFEIGEVEYREAGATP